MNALFRCLSCPISEDYKLFLVRKNLLARYAVGVAPLDIANLQELSNACKRIDGALNRQIQPNMPFQYYDQNNYKPLNRNNVRCKEVHAIDQVAENIVDNPEILEVRAEHINPLDNNIPRKRDERAKCWNCNVDGHRYQSCELPRKKFCFRCGLPNVIAPYCQKCKGNDNRNLGAVGNDRA